MIYNAVLDNPFFILLVILLVFGGVAVIVYLLRKYLPGFKEKEEKVSEEEVVIEELERVLVEVDDEVAKKQIEQYNKDSEPSKKNKDKQ